MGAYLEADLRTSDSKQWFPCVVRMAHSRYACARFAPVMVTRPQAVRDGWGGWRGRARRVHARAGCTRTAAGRAPVDRAARGTQVQIAACGGLSMQLHRVRVHVAWSRQVGASPPRRRAALISLASGELVNRASLFLIQFHDTVGPLL